MISFVSRYFSLPIHGPPYNYYLDETFGYGSYDSQAYPSYLNTIDDGEFKDFINLRTQILSLENVDTSPKIAKIVSVDDLGAKGDGADDTEVWKKSLIRFLF